MTAPLEPWKVLPHGQLTEVDDHRVDAKPWLQRYPTMQVAAPEGAREKALEGVPVEATSPGFGDTNVQWVSVPDTREHEAAPVVRGAKGATIIVNDLIANLRREHGFTGWMLRLMGFAGDEPHIPGVRRLAMAKDSKALAEQLFQWSEIADLRCALVSHGEPIVDAPRAESRRLSESLR